MKLVIQIPAYNEEEQIEGAVTSLPKHLPRVDSIEVVVVDDGSTDRTAEKAANAGASVVRLTSHQGLSAAFRSGLDHALRHGADIIVNTDADNQYVAEDIALLIAPILGGSADVVIGDRNVRQSPHMGPIKKILQRIGSWAVSVASGLKVPDVTSGFRAFSREAAIQINVFNPFTYTLETIIQAGHRNLELRSVKVRTNPPTRPSRLYRGMGTYVRKSIVTIFRIYTIYRPLKTFFLIGSLLVLAGVAIGARFLYYFFTAGSAGHVQSLILSAVFLITGFQTMLIGLLADLISVNRRLHEDTLVRLKHLQFSSAVGKTKQQRSGRRQKDAGEAPPEKDSHWVWLVDEEERESSAPASARPRRKKRRHVEASHRVKDPKRHRE
ncbi:MAG: glycosyltransferase family 2 protein [Thermoanaerobaculia bacterium]|nr:glycosyltransferase family 2 protein [Thermoanaerobaculia bacterium]